MTAAAAVLALAMGVILLGYLLVWVDERLDARGDRVVGWCADCAEPVEGLADHLTARHPGTADIYCAPCGRRVDTPCLDAHRALYHRPRPIGIEDLP